MLLRPAYLRGDAEELLRGNTLKTLVASACRCRNHPPPPELLCCGRSKVPSLPQLTWPRFGGAFLSGTTPHARNCPAAEEPLPRLAWLKPPPKDGGFFWCCARVGAWTFRRLAPTAQPEVDPVGGLFKIWTKSQRNVVSCMGIPAQP